MNMGFWNNVLIELDYLGMTNKALAQKAGFAASNIGKGIRMQSSPSADTAVKIANILGVSVEYLVTGKEPPSKKKPISRIKANAPQIRKNAKGL